jgi:MFS family permease
MATGLAGANATVVFATGALVGHSLSGQIALATVPTSLFVVGMALGTLPTALGARRFGRKAVFLAGNLMGAWAGILAALAIYLSSFLLFCMAAVMAGTYQAVVQSYRFAAADTASASFRPRAIAFVQTGGVLAAVLGPQLVIGTKDLLPPYLFVATFIGQGLLAVLAMVATSRFIEAGQGQVITGPARPLSELLQQPRLVVAILCGTTAQVLMNMVMTAAPLAMAMCGHSVVDSTLGIQWHVLAMFAPGFFTGQLINRFGKETVMITGLVIMVGCALVHLMGITVAHFWVALVLLGLGWNFAFVGATSMVTDCHAPSDRAKVQGFNDLCVFGTTAVGSFMAGVVLDQVGWAVLNMALMPIAAACILALIWVRTQPAALLRPENS